MSLDTDGLFAADQLVGNGFPAEVDGAPQRMGRTRPQLVDHRGGHEEHGQEPEEGRSEA